MPMFRLLTTALLVCSTAAAASPQRSERRGDQYQALEATKRGHIRPLREIEARLLPSMRGADYLGPEFDPGSGVYRLKFMRGRSVIWVDVDGRTGAVIGRSG